MYLGFDLMSTLFAWHPTVNSFSHIFITKSLDSRCLCMCELFFFLHFIYRTRHGWQKILEAT